MEAVRFRCTTCGNRTERDILDNRHAILGAINKINREETCCRRPDYVDERGYRKAIKEQELRDYIPGLS